MPGQLKDMLTAYICALCLHVDAFVVNPTTLAKDLQVTGTKAVDLFRQLGCVVETVAKVRKVRLVAPVTFPKPPAGPRAPRR